MKLRRSSAAAVSIPPHLWPDSFRTYSSEIYFDVDDGFAYSDLHGEKTLISDEPSYCWTYNTERKILAAG